MCAFHDSPVFSNNEQTTNSNTVPPPFGAGTASERIQSALQRFGPLSATTLADTLNLPDASVRRTLGTLLNRGKVRKDLFGGQVRWSAR